LPDARVNPGHRPALDGSAFCREREKVVTERRAILDPTLRWEASIRMVAWLTRGMVAPTGDDFNMLRLILIALLPQVGGVLLMIARGGK
jgi:hypothetical protein